MPDSETSRRRSQRLDRAGSDLYTVSFYDSVLSGEIDQEQVNGQGGEAQGSVSIASRRQTADDPCEV